jgi:hypothetical protein
MAGNRGPSFARYNSAIAATAALAAAKADKAKKEHEQSAELRSQPEAWRTPEHLPEHRQDVA